MRAKTPLGLRRRWDQSGVGGLGKTPERGSGIVLGLCQAHWGHGGDAEPMLVGSDISQWPRTQPPHLSGPKERPILCSLPIL